MIIFFRVDASLEIGSGHVMRCLVMAHAFKKIGYVCEFISKNHNGNLIYKIIDEGFKVHVLACLEEYGFERPAENEYLLWLGSNWISDVKLTLDILLKSPNNILIVDHYGIDSRWESVAKEATNKLVVFDDLANRNHNCDLLIDQGIGRKDNDYFKLVPSSCKLLIGKKFVLISPLFKEYKKISRKKRKNSKKNTWLISMGGVDKYNLTSVAIRALESVYANKKIKLKVVLGCASPWISDIENLIASLTLDIELHVDSRNMAKIICDSDCAIGGGGISSLERAYLGLPSITIVMAENQQSSAIFLESLGITKVISGSEDLYSDLIRVVKNLDSDNFLINAMQNNCYSLLDDHGLSRVLRAVVDEE
jgi:UDP-2,4-diacetamido-2,4,6-trideoxy-beta-L-altropyranose hydrolase